MTDELTIEGIQKAMKILKKECPDHFPTHLTPQTKEHWKKHYPELFEDDEI